MKKEIEMQMSRVVLMVILMMVATTGIMASDSQEVPHDAAYEQAKEQMADMLASEDFEMVDISAASFDRAMDLIYRRGTKREAKGTARLRPGARGSCPALW